MTNFDRPLGGTELMYNELVRRLNPKYFVDFSIFNYVSNADFKKPTIYWNQLSYNQEAVNFLNDVGYVNAINHFVFVSYWQAEEYRKRFNIPGYKIKVIKNACLGVTPNFEKPKDKIRICYTSTPWRGLKILLNAWKLLNRDDCELHIFSSSKIYGKEFAEQTEKLYTPLYDMCSSLKNVTYRGSIDNMELRKELPSFHMLAYPCIFEETSCISVIEALSAGLRVLTSSIGALPETTEGWANIYPFLADNNVHIEKYAQYLNAEIDKLKTGFLDEYLHLQSQVYGTLWSWDARINDWSDFLNPLYNVYEL